MSQIDRAPGETDEQYFESVEMYGRLAAKDFPFIADRSPGETDAEYAVRREHWRRVVAGEPLQADADPLRSQQDAAG
ncbi:MAG TPA: hypothetical protein VIQ05_18830 [Tardiphaga sp.]